MLRVPDVRSTAAEFDPVAGYAGVRQTGRHLAYVDANDPFTRYGAILAGVSGGSEAPKARAAANTPELEAIRRRSAAFDDANVRRALTDLHEREEAFTASLADLAGPEVGKIVEMTEEFLQGQKRELAADMAGERQKRMFEQCFAVFAQGVMARADALQEARTRLYQTEVSARQNRAFLAMALRRENLFNDELQTRLRDMYLLNVDNLCADLPENERLMRLGEAHGEFCLAILQHRLEADPGRMHSMLNAPAVRGALGEDVTRRYEELAATAVADAKLREAAGTWCDGGMTPAEAEKEARTYATDRECHAVLTHYRRFREIDNRERVLLHAAETERLWREIRAGDLVDNVPLGTLRRSDPEMADFLAGELSRVRRNGGQPPRPDYACLLRLAENFDPARAAETLRERKRFLAVLEELGGLESPPYALYMRLVTGGATAEDQALLEDLRLARGIVVASRGEEEAELGMSEYLWRFWDTLRIASSRRDTGELTSREKVENARAVMEVVEWPATCAAAGEPPHNVEAAIERAAGPGCLL